MSSVSAHVRLFPSFSTFEAIALQHPEVLGVLYTGSLGRGSFDRFSDFDIEVWVPDAWLDDGPARIRELMGWLGPVHFAYDRGPAFATGFVGTDWRRADLSLKRRSELNPGPEFAGAQVVKDTDGVLARLVAESQLEVVSAGFDQARAAIEEAI